MPEQTQNYDLIKQLPAEFYNRELDNQNLDVIDALIKALQDSKANGTDLTSLSNTLTQHLDETPTKTKAGHVKLQENFINGALQNSWQGTFEYAKNDLGMVSLALEIYGTVVAGSTIIATLPVGYRPKKAVVVPIVTDLTDGIKHLIITPSGSIVIPNDAPVVVNKVYLSSISFYAKEV